MRGLSGLTLLVHALCLPDAFCLQAEVSLAPRGLADKGEQALPDRPGSILLNATAGAEDALTAQAGGLLELWEGPGGHNMTWFPSLRWWRERIQATVAPWKSWETVRAERVSKAGMTWQSWTVLAIMLTVLTLLFLEIRSPWVIFFVALTLVWNLGIITSRDALKGFANPALVTVGALFIIVKGVDRAKFMDRAAKLCLGADSTESGALMRICGLVFCFGAFINNTPLVALLMPIIRDWARTRGFAPSKFLIPLAFASIVGGNMTIIGSSMNLMVAGMLTDETGEVFFFLDPARVGWFVSLASMGYLLTLGVRFLPEEKGGLFKALKEQKDDMVTQIQVSNSFPLVGSDLREALQQLRIPQDALLKVFRQPAKRRMSKANLDMPSPAIPGPAMTPQGPRLSRNWGTLPPGGRERAFTTEGVPGTPGQPHRVRADSTWSAASGNQEGQGQPGDAAMREIFPVPEHEILEGGDTLLLSLPVEKCVALAESEHVARILKSAAVDADMKEEALPSLRIHDVDLLNAPGRENEFVELVISQSNPFVGEDFASTDVRRRFEKQYEVGILALRQASRPSLSKKGLLLPSQVFSRQESFAEAVKGGRSRGVSWGGEMTIPQVQTPRDSGISRILRFTSETEEVLQVGRRSATAEAEDEQEVGKDEIERVKYLRPGDAVLVLARAGGEVDKLKLSMDFMATTQVSSDEKLEPPVTDYMPLVIFILGLLLVAMNVVSMAQVSLGLAALFVLVGWVDPMSLRETIDWNLLALIGCALGLAEAVKNSGLSPSAANVIKNANLGVHGTTCLLFLFTMMIAELVTSNAAAALGFPLAVDLSAQLGLRSSKALAMTVMIASNTSFMNPVSSAATLMIMGPGGYRFLDFMKVGFLMDLIFWIGTMVFIPIMFDTSVGPAYILPAE